MYINNNSEKKKSLISIYSTIWLSSAEHSLALLCEFRVYKGIWEQFYWINQKPKFHVDLIKSIDHCMENRLMLL